MSEEGNAATYRRLFEDAPNQRDLRIVDELVAPGFIGHWLFNAPPLHGREDFRRWLAGLFAAFPDWRTTIDDALAQGDRVAARWTGRGTEAVERQEAGHDHAADGRVLAVQGMHIARFADSRLVELWHSQDLLSTFQQLGVLPAPAH